MSTEGERGCPCNIVYVFILICTWEDRSCWCRHKSGGGSECGSDLVGGTYCRNPCKHYGKVYYCGKGRDCYSSSDYCDSTNDCGDWTDEKGCRITYHHGKDSIKSQTHLKGSETKYSGNVYVLGRPVCDHGWDDNDAKVLCRTLGHDMSHTHAMAWHNSTFGNVGTNFVMNDVNCHGHESYIGDCGHVTTNDCGTTNGAGVTCIDALSMELSKGVNEYEGIVHIINQPVCYDGWNLKNDQELCNKKLKSKFSGRKTKIVPVFSTLPINYTSPKFVNCNGTDIHQTICTLDDCESSNAVQVKCAKCTPEHLLSILNGIKAGTQKELHKSVCDALLRLSTECHDWDCSKEESDYFEFCEIKTFLDTAFVYLNSSDSKFIRLQTQFDYSSLLRHNFMTQSFADLKDRIFGIKSTISDFQKHLARYFIDVANFDRQKANADLDAARELFSSTHTNIDEKKDALKKQLTDILRLAMLAASLDRVEHAAEVVATFLSEFSPLKWLTGGSSPTALNIKVVVAKMMKGTAALKRLGRALNTEVPKLKEIEDRIQRNEKQVRANFAVMAQTVTHNRKFTKTEAMKFLSVYKSFTPSMTSQDIVEYHTIASTIISTACNTIKDADTVMGLAVTISEAALGSCAVVLPTLEVLTSFYQSSLGYQTNLVASAAEIARARVSEESAMSLNKHLESNLDEERRRKVVTLHSLFHLQTYKENLLKHACSYVTYHNHGKVQDFCSQLLENPNLDTKDLIAYNYNTDMCCCSTCSITEKILPIPAAVNDGLKPFPPGTIDLTHLYGNTSLSTSSWIKFRIPNRKWLLDNGWVSDHVYKEGSNQFLQSIQLYIPPSSDYQCSINTAFWLDGPSLVKDTRYLIPDVKMATEYLENPYEYCLRPMPNLFNTPKCRNLFKGICMTSSPIFKSNIYPSLVGSTWKVSLDSPCPLTPPFPGGTFYLKAKVKFCQKSSVKRHRQDIPFHPVCCWKRNKYYDQIIAAKSDGHDPCHLCPDREFPRMNGFYCESCPAGYEEMESSYGCSPCKKGEFKAKPGRSRCQPCPAGETTLAIGQDRCMRRK